MRESTAQLTPAQVAQYCGVSPQTVNDWLNKGRLNAVNEPQGTLVGAEELIEFMDENHLAIPADLLSTTKNAEPVVAASVIHDFDGPHALLVETEADTTRILEPILKEIGIEPMRIASSAEINAHIAGAAPKLITVEIDAGDQLGLLLIKKLREQNQYDHTKILVTSNQMPSALAKAKSAGADAVITKPLLQAI